MTDRERIEKIIKDTFDVIQKVYHTQREGMEIIKIFVNHNQELSSPNTVSNIVIVKLASASKS